MTNQIIGCKLYNDKISIFGREIGGEERRNATKETEEKKKSKGEAQVDVIEGKNEFQGCKEKRFWREKRQKGREKGKEVWEKKKV